MTPPIHLGILGSLLYQFVFAFVFVFMFATVFAFVFVSTFLTMAFLGVKLCPLLDGFAIWHF